MRIEQEKVEQFHRDKLLETSRYGKPMLAPFEIALQRYWLLGQEASELMDAHAAGDLVGVADAIGDLLYVVLGAAVENGIDAQSVFDEVHRSNMTKTPLDPVTKKGGKGPGYEPPRIAEILLNQSTGLLR